MSESQDLLTLDQLDESILEIVSGKRVINLVYPNRGTRRYIFRLPTGEERLLSKYVEKKSLDQAIRDGLPREDELPEEMVHSYFTTEDQEKLETTSNKVSAYEKMVKKGIKGSVIHDRNKEKLKDLQKEKEKLIRKKNLAKQLSADFKASEDKYYFLMSKCVLNINKEPVWSSIEELWNEDDLGYIETLLYHEFIPFLVGHETKVLRYIARSGQWSNRFYSAVKAGVGLFSQNPEDFSTDQLALLSWSIFYYNINEMADEYKPEDHIIENDEMLDEYLEDLTSRIKTERYARKKSKAGSKMNSSNHQNIIVTADNREFVSLHKDGVYSDPREITGRAKDKDKSTSYSEAAQIREAKRRLRSKRKKR